MWSPLQRMMSGNLESRRFPEGAWRRKNHIAGIATPPFVFSNSCLVSSLNAFIFNPLHIYNTIDIILQLYCRHLYQISKAHVYNQKNESFSS